MFLHGHKMTAAAPPVTSARQVAGRRKCVVDRVHFSANLVLFKQLHQRLSIYWIHFTLSGLKPGHGKWVDTVWLYHLGSNFAVTSSTYTVWNNPHFTGKWDIPLESSRLHRYYVKRECNTYLCVPSHILFCLPFYTRCISNQLWTGVTWLHLTSVVMCKSSPGTSKPLQQGKPPKHTPPSP